MTPKQTYCDGSFLHGLEESRRRTLLVLVGYPEAKHNVTHTKKTPNPKQLFSHTHKYIAFPLSKLYRLSGVIFVTFGSFPLVQNIQNKTKKKFIKNKLIHRESTLKKSTIKHK